MDDDLFYSIANVEDEFEDAGYIEGLEAGKVAGRIEGRGMGCDNGLDIGREVGFYQGWVQQWLRAASARPELVPERVVKKLAALQSVIDEVPAANGEGADFADRLKAIHQKFKTVSAMLGINVAAELPSSSLSF
ncbi:hypothetical protein GGI04_003729 [Coemansia thaxteri]|uniref:Essential protein Yae1 N-terminal domain-containing protein n=1 Tax=Coemansia thaxteri TaxID=2663907 RepID=A0A9W8BEB3_9FUNG|nr:hypothetical protein H4R26_005388 [Coemansia thaxteri]KAJ2001448.1 hypothetical protein GGI04_003729 [Coemansia thaxteri]KAJ2467632.1 hypothetical protein GGI02_003971 [Coemansia sp. RSA 2322]KAJ2477446.1 hypothetical protein EV174_004618 [Coemansia sp. RSA 2320]